MLIYKIIDQALWDVLENTAQSLGSADDLRDGYIHFSTAEQLLSTFEKYFAARLAAGEALYLLSSDTQQWDSTLLRFEASRGGALFPHWYAPLTRAMVTAIEPIDALLLERFAAQT